MPRQDEINRMIVLIYTSRNSSGFTNYTRKIDWLDGLPMEGLKELSSDFDRFKAEVEREIEQRIKDDMPRYPRSWHESQEEKRKQGEALLKSIGVNTSPKDHTP